MPRQVRTKLSLVALLATALLLTSCDNDEPPTGGGTGGQPASEVASFAFGSGQTKGRNGGCFFSPGDIDAIEYSIWYVNNATGGADIWINPDDPSDDGFHPINASSFFGNLAITVPRTGNYEIDFEICSTTDCCDSPDQSTIFQMKTTDGEKEDWGSLVPDIYRCGPCPL